MIKMNREQYDKVTKSLVQLILEAEGLVRTLTKYLLYCSTDVDIPALYSCQTRVSYVYLIKILRDARAKGVSRQKEICLVQVVISL